MFGFKHFLLTSNWIASSQRTQIVQHWLFKIWDLYYNPAYFIRYRVQVLNSPTMIMEGPFLSLALSIFASYRWGAVISIFLMTLIITKSFCPEVYLINLGVSAFLCLLFGLYIFPIHYSLIYLWICISIVLYRQYRVGSWFFRLFWQFLPFNWSVSSILCNYGHS